MILNKNIKWYNLNNILQHEGQYYVILGERSNGKSFALNKYIIDRFFEHGEQFAYVKRFEEDIKKKYMGEVFTPLLDYTRDKYKHEIKFYQGKFLVYPIDSEGKLSECEVMGTAFSIANVNRTKGTSYPQITTILFEEFMSVDCTYLPDELNLFLNLVSTIVRYRTNVKVFMLANTISKFSPYLSSLGLKAHRLKKGAIVNKIFTDNKGFNTKFVIERTENVNVFDNSDNKEKTVYNIFGTSGVGKMITSGEFETHAYKRQIDNFTFEETKYKGCKIIGNKYKTSFVLRFEDYYYRIYLITDNVKLLTAYREIDVNSIKSSNTTHIINGTEIFEGVANINNIMKYNDPKYNEYIDYIVGTINQNDFITMTDDDGENVINAFRIAGLAYQHK